MIFYIGAETTMLFGAGLTRGLTDQGRNDWSRTGIGATSICFHFLFKCSTGDEWKVFERDRLQLGQQTAVAAISCQTVDDDQFGRGILIFQFFKTKHVQIQLEEQELFTFPEYPSQPPVLLGFALLNLQFFCSALLIIVCYLFILFWPFC